MVGALIAFSALTTAGVGTGVAAGAVAEGAAATMLYKPPFKLSTIFVPLPSFAKTAPEEKITDAWPLAFGLKLIRQNGAGGAVKTRIRQTAGKTDCSGNIGKYRLLGPKSEN